MTILKPWPEHNNPNPNGKEIASAPYNFVPLPEKVIPAVRNADELPDHDQYDRTRYSGYFDVTLTTRSPLYIRCALSLEDFLRQEQDSQLKNTPEFFYTNDKRTPVIPGSSLRGMLRALLEIVSYGKMQSVSEKQLFFRTVDKSAVGSYYNHRMVEKLEDVYGATRWPVPRYRARVEGGFFRVRENGTYFIEECTVARVDTPDVVKLFELKNDRELYQLDGRDLDGRTANNPNQMPNWLYQHREIWADIEKDEKDYFFPKKLNKDGKGVRHPDLYLRFRRARDLRVTQAQGKQSGKLVLTGHMINKHLAFLFVPLERPAILKVPNDPREQDPNKRLLDRFHDDDQLTQWQKKAFPADRSPNIQPQPDGQLHNGDPVFFLRDENRELVFFGRAHMFRLPYKKRPIDLVPDKLQQATDIDYAEALFGFVQTDMKAIASKQGDKSRAYAGRIVVTDGVLQSDPTNIWLMGDIDKEITPRILATPKPTAFQHYLTQQYPDDKRKLNHYDSVPPDSAPPGSYETVIRGHKLYWHQGLGIDQNLTLEQIRTTIKEPAQVNKADTQHTCFKPLKPGVEFSFRVHFENLSDRELGALCWTLHPNGEQGQSYCHHLGMGKPLGMGAVGLHARLHIIDRPLRYKTLFSGTNWQLGESTTSKKPSDSTQPIVEVEKATTGEDLAIPAVLARLTQPFEKHLLHELNPDPPCIRLADMLRIAMLLKLLEWPGYRAVDNSYQEKQPLHPNTRYMKIQPNEYRDRPVLPDPRLFDTSYFESKSRPQGSREAMMKPLQEREDLLEPVQVSDLTAEFYVGREISNLNNYTSGEQGVEVRFWDRNPTQIIGFIPKELIDKPLGQKISVVVTGQRQESNGRIIIELKLRSKK